MNQDNDRLFEEEVRRVARALWENVLSSGPTKIDDRERDGIFDDGEIVHIVEATTSRRKDKITYDLEKSVTLAQNVRKKTPEKLVKIWSITREDPTADQRDLAPKFRKKARCPVEIISIREFSSKIIDSIQYLRNRENYPFGSVRKPEDDTDHNVPENEYIPLELIDTDSEEIIDANNFTKKIIDKDTPEYILLIGDYGSGKSMTLRHMFYNLRDKHLRGDGFVFPVYLNLRDHYGQDDPSEALLRHANRIGLSDPSKLVAAWRAGFVQLFLDGFDEVSAVRLVRGAEKIRQARRQAMRLVNKFINESPKGYPLVISGRENYFDSRSELISSLGLKSNFKIFNVNEFTELQIERYLTKKGIKESIPFWLPARPLLLGYLVVRALSKDEITGISSLSKEEGWNYILDRVCEREARQIDPVVIDPPAVREFTERLATKARTTPSGRGPIEIREMGKIFESVFDAPPDEKAEIFLLRLPGLSSASDESGSREFIDDDFVDACRAGDIVRLVQNPFSHNFNDLLSAHHHMGELGIGIASTKLLDQQTSEKQLSSALHDIHKTENSSYSALIDVINIIQSLSLNYTGEHIRIKDGYYKDFSISGESNLQKIEFFECCFSSIEIPTTNNKINGPKFSNCLIEKVIGPTGEKDLPISIFPVGNNIVDFETETNTNTDILKSNMPANIKALLTIMRKLFLQSLSGRKENAFYRGNFDSKTRSCILPMLELLQKHDFVFPHRVRKPPVWIPNRSKTKEAREIIGSPQNSKSPLIIEALGK